jgi:uncharacterized protein YndB with AHSA1/START domain
MLLKIGIAVGVIVLAFLGIVALRPSEYRVTRTATIAAPPSAVFPHVNELRKFNVWNPWSKLDPATKVTFDGPPAGPGAVMAWSGDKNVGEGRMIITESRPNELVRFRLEFLKPFAGTANADFTFTPAANGTTVTWSMAGQNNFVAKAIGLFMNMDTMIGGQFEKGLASLNQETKR